MPPANRPFDIDPLEGDFFKGEDMENVGQFLVTAFSRDEIASMPLDASASKQDKLAQLQSIAEQRLASLNIPTPPPTSPECAASELAVVLVPLVLFGPAGARAGRGAGYYDRTFAWLRDEVRPTTPLLIGLGHDFQEVSDLAPKPWDVALDLVVTPTRTIRT